MVVKVYFHNRLMYNIFNKIIKHLKMYKYVLLIKGDEQQMPFLRYDKGLLHVESRHNPFDQNWHHVNCAQSKNLKFSYKE